MYTSKRYSIWNDKTLPYYKNALSFLVDEPIKIFDLGTSLVYVDLYILDRFFARPEECGQVIIKEQTVTCSDWVELTNNETEVE